MKTNHASTEAHDKRGQAGGAQFAVEVNLLVGGQFQCAGREQDGNTLVSKTVARMAQSIPSRREGARLRMESGDKLPKLWFAGNHGSQPCVRASTREKPATDSTR